MYLMSELLFSTSGASVRRNANVKIFVLQKFWILECLSREGTCVLACTYRWEIFPFLYTSKWTKIPTYCCGNDKDAIYGTSGHTQ